MIDFGRFSHLMFDCYGTLIDWETGILDTLMPMLENRGMTVDEGHVLQLYAVHEARHEAGRYRCYREVLRNVTASVAADLGFSPAGSELDALAASIGDWPPFDDTEEALARMKGRFKLAILSNIDDDLFARTAGRLKVDFDEVVTAQQVGSYKPSPENFQVALDRLGVTVDRVLHVAQSLFHDHVPAKALGFATVWVNRPSRRSDVGMTPRAEAAPDLEVSDLRTLADAIGL